MYAINHDLTNKLYLFNEIVARVQPLNLFT